MLAEILRRTPGWAFVLFFVLLAVGYLQSKGQVVKRGRVAVLPVAMIVLSLYGVMSAFGNSSVALVSWTAGAGIAGWVGVLLGIPRGVRYSRAAGAFSVPGSWLPLALMMAIYFTRYATAVVLARQLPVAGEPAFVGSVGLCYGACSGLFLARVLVIRRAAERSSEDRA
jgi:hypothetical protein